MDVIALQKALKSIGYDPGPVDGDLGPRTRAAVALFQKAAGLLVDGIVGQQTRAALVAAGGLPAVVSLAPGAKRARRDIDLLVWHCTATPEGIEFSVAQITAMHKARGFSKIGYHRLIHLDGGVDVGRKDEEVGAHVQNFNARSLGFSYVGGVDASGKAKDTRTFQQKKTMLELTKETIKRYGLNRVVGHRDLSPDRDHDGVVEPHEWVKVCPCFTVAAEYGHLLK